MTVRRFVEDLLRGSRPRPFRPDEEDAAQMRAAITLRAGRVGSGAPREEFVADLERRLAAELSDPAPAAGRPTRRRALQFGSVAAAALTVGVVADRGLVAATSAQPDPELTPTAGTWTRVAVVSELPDGGVTGFEVGGMSGFVRRDGGRLAAVSGACTHQGCRLRLDAPAHLLRCPCHTTAFAVTGELVTHQLPVAPRALPAVAVRENGDAIEVLAPPPP